MQKIANLAEAEHDRLMDRKRGGANDPTAELQIVSGGIIQQHDFGTDMLDFE